MDYQILTNYYCRYKEGKVSYPQLEAVVHQYVYCFPRKKLPQSFNRDLCGEFWSSFEENIPRLIKMFSDRGVPFGGYINFILRYQFITFLDQMLRTRRAQKLYASRSAAMCLDQALYGEIEIPEVISAHENQKNFITMIDFLDEMIKKNTEKQRLWWFVLYHSPLIPLIRIRQIAKRLNVPEENCSQILAQLEKDIDIQRKRKKLLEEKCNSYFTRRNIYEQKLELAVQSPEEREYSIRMRKIYETRFQNALTKLQKLSFAIPHSRLSEVLNVPKGTIDSGIALLRKKCRHLLNEGKEAGLV